MWRVCIGEWLERVHYLDSVVESTTTRSEFQLFVENLAVISGSERMLMVFVRVGSFH